MIGNSLSQDIAALTEYLSPDLFVRNLYLGGCTLEMHRDLALENKAAYSYQQNGGRSLPQDVSIDDALAREKWDTITVQQQSALAADPASFDPYLGELIAHVRRSSDAEIVFLRTWAYETGSTNPTNSPCSETTVTSCGARSWRRSRSYAHASICVLCQ